MTREEAIDLLDNLIGMIEDNHNSDYDTAFRMAIKALEQEPKTGHWIEVLDEEGFIDGNPMKLYHYECSECSCEDANLGKNNYCPNCGARMTEGSDTE